MHISLDGVFNMHPLKYYGGFCVIPLNAFNYIYNYMADSALILYLEFLKGLISHFQKLGQCNLNKKNYRFVKNVFKTSSNKPPDRFRLNLG